MNLYEVTNGYTGYAYVRVYVWATNEEQALEIAQEAFRKENERDYDERHRHKSKYWQNLECRHLFSNDAEPFVTAPSDTGWDVTAVPWEG